MSFVNCTKGHVPYSAAFDECPSCKVVRNRELPASKLRVASPSMEARIDLVDFLADAESRGDDREHAIMLVDLIDALIVARVRDVLTTLREAP